MIEVTAKGIRDGNEILVECDFKGNDISFLFNGDIDYDLEGVILNEMEEHHAIGGTYFPTTKKLNLIAVLEGYFFDYNPDVKVVGDVESIPYKKRAVY